MGASVGSCKHVDGFFLRQLSVFCTDGCSCTSGFFFRMACTSLASFILRLCRIRIFCVIYGADVSVVSFASDVSCPVLLSAARAYMVTPVSPRKSAVQRATAVSFMAFFLCIVLPASIFLIMFWIILFFIILSPPLISDLFLLFLHSDCCYADESVTQQKQCGQNQHDGEHTHYSASCHQHAHGADDVDIGVDCYAKGCREKSHSGYDNGWNGGGKCNSYSLFLVFAAHAFLLISGGHEDGIVNSGSKLNRTDTDRGDEGQALSQIMRQSQIDEDSHQSPISG